MNGTPEQRLSHLLTELGLSYSYRSDVTAPSFSVSFNMPSGPIVIGIAALGTIVSVLSVWTLPRAWDPTTLLRLNAEFGLAKIGLANDVLVVAAQLPLHNLDAEALLAALGAVLAGVQRFLEVTSSPALPGR